MTPHGQPLLVEISAGELFDKITILEIKRDRLRDEAQLRNVRAELSSLMAARDRVMAGAPGLDTPVAELKALNEQLWQVEEDIRACEARHDFGPAFIELARSIYRLNDRRAAAKRAINERTSSRIVEEKSYPGYARE